jgi:hypothetical protein
MPNWRGPLISGLAGKILALLIYSTVHALRGTLPNFGLEWRSIWSKI